MFTGPVAAIHCYGRRLRQGTYLNTVVVETYLGTGSYGPRYAEPRTLSPDTGNGVLVDETTRLVRASDGSEVVSSSTIDAPVSEADNLVVGSRITLPSGDVTVVITRSVRVDGVAPDRVQVACE